MSRALSPMTQPPFEGCQIAVITNGFLVQLPGIQTKEQGTILEPRTIYCEDKQALVNLIGELIPSPLSVIK